MGKPRQPAVREQKQSKQKINRLGEFSITMGVDRQLTFEIPLYLNIFYFGLYAGMEAIFLLMKYYYVADMDNLTMLNEFFLKKISVVFRILLLTVPAQYLTLYFTFWQTKVTQVDAMLGIILLIFQYIQMVCAFLTCVPNRGRICFNPFETDWDKLS